MLLLNKQMTTNYRKEWFNWVAKTRKRLSTKKKPCSHKEAMAKARITWPKEKAKLERRAGGEAGGQSQSENRRAQFPTGDAHGR